MLEFGVFFASCTFFSESPELDSEIRSGIEQSSKIILLSGEEKYQRSEESTFLTLPEWFIVYSAREYADFVEQKNSPSGFPYFRSITQYWENYCSVTALTHKEYGFNMGNHVMLFVIGNSFTAEYAMKGLYENTFGRVTEWISTSAFTEEDAYASQVSREYALFLDHTPFYSFPYAKKLQGLWTETSFFGDEFLRKWERRFSLTLEYGIKSLYSSFIRSATGAAYAPTDDEILLITSPLLPALQHSSDRIAVVNSYKEELQLVRIPRYQAFTDTILDLKDQDIVIYEIAGNDRIALTALAPFDWSQELEKGIVHYSLPVLTRPDVQRVFIEVSVTQLLFLLRELHHQDIIIEHLYDY